MPRGKRFLNVQGLLQLQSDGVLWAKNPACGILFCYKKQTFYYER